MLLTLLRLQGIERFFFVSFSEKWTRQVYCLGQHTAQLQSIRAVTNTGKIISSKGCIMGVAFIATKPLSTTI